MLETRELTYAGGGLKVRLELGQATVLAGMKRALLQGRANAYLDTLDATDAAAALDVAAQHLLVRLLYPDLLACVVSAEGLDAEMDVETFLALPEPLTDAWQNLAYELNPHWYPFARPADETEAAEKNAPAPNSASASDS